MHLPHEMTANLHAEILTANPNNVNNCLDGLPKLLCACRRQRKGLATRQSQAFPASAGGPSPHKSPRRHPRGVASLEGWSSGQDRSTDRYRCGGTGLPQASGLYVSLPVRCAIARLVPSVCGTLPPREGGLHVRFSHRLCASCHGEAASLAIGCAADPTLSCGLLRRVSGPQHKLCFSCLSKC